MTELEHMQQEAEAQEKNFEARQEQLRTEANLMAQPLRDQNEALRQQQLDYLKHITLLRAQNTRLRYLASMSLNAGQSVYQGY